MGIELIGMVGTRSASELDGPQASLVGGHIDAEFLKRFSLAHEEAGFDKVLIGYGSSGPDGFSVASYISSFTTRLKAWNTATSSVQGDCKSSSSSARPASSRALPRVAMILSM